MEHLTIGQLAATAGVNVQTVRYYERRGLLCAARRRQSGYREFAPEDGLRIRFIKRAQQLGFTLQEIGELLALRVDSASAGACDAVRTQTREKISEIDAKLQDLQQMRQNLQRLVDTCAKRQTTSSCPILDAFEEEAQ